jgi:NADPH2 dehydrogenase
MGMKDPAPTFTELISRVRNLYPELAYLHVVEPCVNGFEPREVQPGESNDFLRNIWGSRPLISTGGYDREVAISTAKEKGGAGWLRTVFCCKCKSPSGYLRHKPC